MSRTIAGTPFIVCYQTELTSIIRGHYVYKEVWDAVIGEMLEAALDDQEEAKEYDKYPVGLYKKTYLRWASTNKNFNFMFPFYESRSREQNKSIYNWKTTTGSRACRSGKVKFHDKQ